jgi:hypothetical protein
MSALRQHTAETTEYTQDGTVALPCRSSTKFLCPHPRANPLFRRSLDDSIVIRRQLRRHQVLAFFGDLPSCIASSNDRGAMAGSW